MTKTYPVTKESRAAHLTEALRNRPPAFRFTRGMADAARKLETEKDRRS